MHCGFTSVNMQQLTDYLSSLILSWRLPCEGNVYGNPETAWGCGHKSKCTMQELVTVQFLVLGVLYVNEVLFLACVKSHCSSTKPWGGSFRRMPDRDYITFNDLASVRIRLHSQGCMV